VQGGNNKTDSGSDSQASRASSVYTSDYILSGQVIS